MEEQAAIDRLAYRPPEAAQVTGVSIATIYREMQAGRLHSFTVGSARLISRHSLEDWLRQHEGDAHTSGAAPALRKVAEIAGPQQTMSRPGQGAARTGEGDGSASLPR